VEFAHSVDAGEGLVIQTYTVIFDIPAESPDFIIMDIGYAIEDMLNTKYPDMYQDVMWKEGE